MTASGGIKVGSAATIHSTGQFNIGVAATIFASGNATFAGITTTAGSVVHGRLLVGTDTEGQVSADDLTIAGSGNQGITIRSGSTSNGNIYFSDSTSGDAEYVGYIEYNHNVNQFAFGTNASAKLKIDSSGNTTVGYGNVGILTTNVNTEHIAGAASSFVGLYINDGFIGFPTSLNRDGGYFISTTVNALNAGPVSLGATMTLHGTWVIV